MFPQIRNLALTALSLTLISAATLSPSAQAETVNTRVFRIEAPATRGGEFQVLSTTDGRVYFIAPTDANLLTRIRNFAKTSQPARLILDGERVIDFSPLSGAEASEYTDAFNNPAAIEEAESALKADEDAPSASASSSANLLSSYAAATAQGYQPTILGSMSEAQRLFSAERELDHGSQCYERAHVWSREFEQAFAVKSMKVFMFFTKTFRNRYTRRVVLWDRPYKWWFHVAPFVYVGENNTTKEVVLDREFLNQAVSMDDWTFEFIGKVRHSNREVPNPTRAQAQCLDASRYNEFQRNPSEPRYCVLRKVPMYYFQPLDVEALDCRPEIENANNRPNRFLPNGQPQYPCFKGTMNTWRASDLQRALKNTKR